MASSSRSSSRLVPFKTSSASSRAARASSARDEYEMQRFNASRVPLAVSRSARSTAPRAPGPSRVRSPSTCTATPWRRNSATSWAMYSSRRLIKAEISLGGRCQFSSENANNVRTSMPASIAPSTASRTAFMPARWPSGRGRWRSRAQRPLPSMMTATWRGMAPLSLSCERRSSDISDLEDLRLLRLQDLVDRLEVFVVQLLRVLLAVLLLIFGYVLGLLDLVDRVGAGVPPRPPSLFGVLMDHLHQLLAALFGQRRQGDANDVAVIRRRETQLGALDGLLDRLQQAFVPRLYREQLGLGRRDARHLVQRHLVAVGFHAHEVEQRGARLAGAHCRKLAPRRLDRLVHRLLGLFEMVRDGHWRMVPTRSPARTLAVAPGWLMLNTTMGSLFSLHSPNAFASITAYPFTSASWKVSSGMNFAAGSLRGSAV